MAYTRVRVPGWSNKKSMKLYPADIYTKNDRGNITVWISENAITINCGVSEEMLRTTCRKRYNKKVPDSFLKDFRTGVRQLLPDTGTGWRYGRVNGQYYYCLDNIPPRYRSLLPPREELIDMAQQHGVNSANSIREQFANHLRSSWQEYIDQEDIPYYMYQSGFNISLTDANEMATGRAWLEMTAHYEDSRKYQEHGIRFEADFFDIAVSVMPNLTGNSLNTAESLRKKIHYYRNSQDKRSFMISGKLGNDNRRIVGIYPVVSPETGEIFNFDIHEALIYELWMNPGSPGKKLKVDVAAEYEQQIEQYGFSPVSSRTVAHYLNRFSNRALMSLERDGRDYFTDTYKPYILQHKLKMALTMWAADYSGSKLYYKANEAKWVNGKRQKSTVTKARSWYLFRVFDVASGCVKGWSVCNSGEDWKQVAEGLSMAVNNSDGRAACELVTDNGPAFTQKENAMKLALLFKKHRRIEPGNKQSNPAELFIHLQSQKARQFDNWMKSSFYATGIDNMANPDYLDINKLPTREEALEQISELIEQWNNTARKDGIIPSEFSTNPENFNPKAGKVDDRVMRYVFGYETRVRLSRTRGNLILNKTSEVGSMDYKFQIKNWETSIELIDNALGGSSDLNVKVHWNEKGADIYSLEGRYIISADPAGLAHKSEFEADIHSWENLEEQTAAKKRFERTAREFQENVSAAREALEEPVNPDELTYVQRASLNKGKAKEENNAIMQAVYAINKKAHQQNNNDDEPFVDDVLNDF